MDKTAFSFGPLHGASDEKAYWSKRTALERLAAIEVMRQIFYGYDPVSTRFQRVLTFAQSKGG
jgi:hypothetical protein